MNIDVVGILLWLLQIGITGFAVLAFFGLAPAKLGERALGHFLEQRLASLRHEQNEKIEQLKAELAHLSDRGVTSNEREYAALTAVWENFVEAYLSTHACVASFIENPDLNRMDDDRLNAFLSSTEMTDRQRQIISSASDKNRAYVDVIIARQISRASKDIFDMRILLRRQEIFIPETQRDLIAEPARDHAVAFRPVLRIA
jgi:hypothetical protein